MITELAGELDRLHQRRDALAGEIEEAFLAHAFGEILITLPGIGPRTGARSLAEIGDARGFASGSSSRRTLGRRRPPAVRLQSQRCVADTAVDETDLEEGRVTP